MQDMPDGYSDAVSAADRTVDVFISIGTGIDITAADDLTSVTGTFLPMSNTNQVTDAVYYMTDGLTTFEGYGIPTAVSAGMIAPPLTAKAYPPEAGIWSDGISDESGAIGFTFVLTLSQAHTSAFRIYTAGPDVLSASAVFINGDTRTTKAFSCHAGYIEIFDTMTYTSIEVTVASLNAPYRHARIVECEFGASISLSKSELGGEVTVIREMDPVELSAPMHELDLSVLNVYGDYDPDNPAGRFGELAIGYPLDLGFTVRSGNGQRHSVRCGRFFIGERSSSETRLDLTAFDARWMLSTVYTSWTMPSGQSLGKTLDDLLTEYAVPHIVDTELFEVMPDGAYMFDDRSSVADDLLTIQQAYAVYCIPDRAGSIRVTRTWPADTYGAMPVTTVYSWPAPMQATRYNFVQIGYAVTENGATQTLYVNADLRTDPSEGKNVLQITGNPLIASQSRATAVMQRLVGRISAQEVETEWRGDPAMDLGDTVQIPGRWTQDEPIAYRAVYIEETYDGSYRAVMRSTD
jgi:hypothetical protein